MKLVCAVTCVSLFLEIVQCARLVYVDKRETNHDSEIEKQLIPRSGIWLKESCCHLPRQLQTCGCCKNACTSTNLKIRQRKSSCCHLPRRLLNCRCCPTACLPSPSVPESPPMLPIKPSQKQSFSCCNLPKPFQNCDCCPSACSKVQLQPLNVSCCHWPPSFQNCLCCKFSCHVTTPIIESSTPTATTVQPTLTPNDEQNVKSNPSSNCCAWFKILRNCNCCPQACKKGIGEETQEIEATTQTVPVLITKIPKNPRDCCHLPKNIQNCNCCPSACKETTTTIGYTEEPVTSLPDNCCNLPKEQQTCSCCPDACGADSSESFEVTPETETSIELVHYENCCNWPKLLQTCNCCPNACILNYQLIELDTVVEDCCTAPLEEQDCRCCPTSPYCALANPFRMFPKVQDPDSALEDDIAPRYWQRKMEHRPETYFVRIPSKKPAANTFHRRALTPLIAPMESDDYSRRDSCYMEHEINPEESYQNLIRRNNWETANLSFMDFLEDLKNRLTGNSPTDSTKESNKTLQTTPVNGLEMLIDIDETNLDDIKPFLADDFPINDYSRPSFDGTPRLNKYLIIDPKRKSDDLQLKSEFTSFRTQPYFPLLSLPSYGKENSGSHALYYDGDKDRKHARYHHAAPRRNSRNKLITRMSRGYRPLIVNGCSNYNPLDLDRLKNRKLFLPVISKADFIYNAFQFDDYMDYVGNEDYDDGKNTFSDRKGNDYGSLPPLEADIDANYYSDQPGDNSYNDDDDIEINPINLVPLQNVFRRVNHLEPYNDDENLLKFYSAPPKRLHESNILDGLAKIATGVEAGHGEIEFEADENYERFLPDSNPKDTEDRFIHHPLRKMVDQDIPGIVPWLNMYDEENFMNNHRKSEFLDILLTNPLNEVELLEITKAGDEVDERRDKGDYIYQNNFMPLPIWSDSPFDKFSEEDLINLGKYYDSIIPNDENLMTQISTTESLLPTEYDNDSEGKNPQKRSTRSCPRRMDPHYTLYLLQKLHNAQRHTRKDVWTPLEVEDDKKKSFGTRDMVLKHLFHTLRGLILAPSRGKKKIGTRSAPKINRRLVQILKRNWIKNNRLKQKKLHPYFRALFPLSESEKELNMKPDDQSTPWPIVYGISDSKTLDGMGIPASFSQQDDPGVSYLEPENDSLLKEKFSDEVEEEIRPISLVVVLTHKIPLSDSFNSDLGNPVHDEIDDSEITPKSRRVLISELITDDLLDSPVDYFEENEEDGILYRGTRTTVEEDSDNSDRPAEEAILKADSLYRMDPIKYNQDSYDAREVTTDA